MAKLIKFVLITTVVLGAIIGVGTLFLKYYIPGISEILGRNSPSFTEGSAEDKLRGYALQQCANQMVKLSKQPGSQPISPSEAIALCRKFGNSENNNTKR